MPNWYPPESVRSSTRQRGDPLPKVVPPGPDNPLGEYKMRLGIPGGAYLIHGTNRPAGVGMQVTHGCIRMYPEDIAELFTLVPINTQVNLIDQTTKVGWSRGALYVERHAPLDGTNDPEPPRSRGTDRLVAAATAGIDATSTGRRPRRLCAVVRRAGPVGNPQLQTPARPQVAVAEAVPATR